MTEYEWIWLRPNMTEYQFVFGKQRSNSLTTLLWPNSQSEATWRASRTFYPPPSSKKSIYRVWGGGTRKMKQCLVWKWSPCCNAWYSLCVDWFCQFPVSRECQDNTLNIFHPPVKSYANPKATILPHPLLAAACPPNQQPSRVVCVFRKLESKFESNRPMRHEQRNTF